MTSEHRGIFYYIAKCVTGCLLLLALGEFFPERDLSWIVISMLLVLSPDEKEVMPLTIMRVKANLIASVASIVFLFLSPWMSLAICLAISVTIVACYIFNLMAGSRAATAAVIIISLHSTGINLWSTAIERVIAVVLGCAFALGLTFIFHREIGLKYARQVRGDRMGE